MAERDSSVVDAALAEWRQGDCVIEGEHWFAHRVALDCPLTDASRAAAAECVDLAEERAVGLVVVTQTCDLVRACAERPFVEVCPLVEVDADLLGEIKRGRRPAYAHLPELTDRRLVAHLDRVMTVEKPLVATWQRTPGWRTDADARAFAQALARKRVRFAFPDDFTGFAKRLQQRMAEKHEKATDEGRGLRALREIRVCAEPSWDADKVALFFWFIRNTDDTAFGGESWANLLQAWLNLVPPAGRFTVEGQVVTLREMTAEEYVESDPLDLDHLSSTSRA